MRPSPPVGYDSSTDHGGKLLIVDVIILIFSLFSVGLRIYNSSWTRRKAFAFYKDDVLCFVAAVCCCPFPNRSRSTSR
jgi:hypothetical protein